MVEEAAAVVAGGSPLDDGGTALPNLGDEDMAAMLMPVLLTGFAEDSSFFSESSLFEDDLVLFLDPEDDVDKVDLLSLAFTSGRASFSLALGDLTAFD